MLGAGHKGGTAKRSSSGGGATSSAPTLPDIRSTSPGGASPSGAKQRKVLEVEGKIEPDGTVVYNSDVPAGIQAKLGASSSEPWLSGRSPGTPDRAAQLRIQKRFERFVERQHDHPSVAARKNIAELQRNIVRDGRMADDFKFYGDKGTTGFRMYLKKRFGSLVNGWRALDTEKTGRLSFHEFCNACHALGYHGNIKMLWRELDYTKSGSVSLMEIDPEVGNYMGIFKSKLMLKYKGNMYEAWSQGIDTNGTGRVEEDELKMALKNLELEEELDANKLFKMMSSKSGNMGVSLSEFDPEAYHRWCSGLLDEDDSPARKKVAGKANQFQLGLTTVDDLKEALRARFGSLFAVWREALDVEGNGRLTFGEFNQALSRLGFHGNLRGLWKDLLRPDQDTISFKDLDPEIDAQVSDLRSQLSKVYFNMMLAWVQGLDTKSTGLVSEAQFIACCEKVGFIGDAKSLFKVIQPDASRSFMCLRDFDTKSYHALSRGDFRMMAQQESQTNTKHPLEMTFHERNAEGFFYKIRQAYEVSRREEFAKVCQTSVPTDDFPDKAEDFPTCCQRKFGSVISAWRNCLDQEKSGRLAFNQFCQACRRLGYSGDLRALWNHYDTKKKGWIALKDLDPEAEEMVGTFLMMLAGRYGTIDNVWRRGFNKDAHDSLSEEELTEACTSLGYKHSAKALFACLIPMPGRQHITIWDLDPLCAKKMQRGDTAYIGGPPKSPTAHTTSRVTTSHPERKPIEAEGKASMTPTKTSSAASPSSTMNGTMRSSSGFITDTVTDIEHLRQDCKNKFGSMLAAWRVAFDPLRTNGVAFSKFVSVLEEMAFQGNVKKLWMDVTEGKRHMATLKDIDPEAQRLVDTTREALVGKFGCLAVAWHNGLSPDGLPRLDEADFVSSCNSELMGSPFKKPARIFRALLTRPGQRSLSLEDLEGLLVGVPSHERALLYAGPLQENETMSSASAFSSTRGLGEHALFTMSAREIMDRTKADYCSHDKAITTLEDFKKKLIEKYGSIFAGWRQSMDADHNGLITKKDFATSCRTIGVKVGQTLWAELDANKTGQVRLKDLDKETGEAFAKFEGLLVKKYGNTKTGWLKCIDAQRQKLIEVERFKAACEALGYCSTNKEEPDAGRLFRLLRPEAARSYLVYEDLWPNLNPNQYPHVKEPTSGKSPSRSSSSLSKTA